MLEQEFQKNTPEKATIVYGSKYLIDDPTSGYPYTGAWTPLPQESPSVAHYIITAAVNQEEHNIIIGDWPEKEDPCTQEDLLDSEENEVQDLIFRISRTLFYIPYRARLAKRLVTLFNDAKEEDSVSLGISAGSLHNFYNFLRLHTKLKCPIVSLTPDYNIYATWRSEQNRVFSVHFLPNGDVRFVICKPNDRHPERQIWISGTATTDVLMETAVPDGVSDWISNER